METPWSSEPAGNFTITLEPVRSSVSLSGRNLQMTLMESSLASLGLGASSAILVQGGL